MIIRSTYAYRTGAIIEGRYHVSDAEAHLIRFVILRPSTEEKWKDYRREQGWPLLMQFATATDRFYEVSTD